MDEQYIKKFKTSYLETKVSEQDIEKSWLSISHRLPHQDNIMTAYVMRYSFLFASILFLLLLGTFSVAQSAHPDEPLYQVKVLSDRIVSKVLNKPQILLERRVKDIMDVSQKSPQQLEKATKEYNKALEQAAFEAKEKDTAQKQALKESLKEQKKQLENVNTTNQKSKELLDNAVKQTQKTQGEVHGASTPPKQQENKSENNNSKTKK